MASRVLPELIVFDLDMCVWHPEMYTLDEIPTKVVQGELRGHGQGVVAALSDGQQVKLFDGALYAFQQVYLGRYPGVKVATASSADTPHAVKVARKCLQLLEVVPGVSLMDVLTSPKHGFEDGSNIQIGRTRPLSSDKSKTHFPILKANTGIEYSGMLFFDDANWDNNCVIVERNCPGVVAQRTPDGLTAELFDAGLAKYHNRYHTK